MHPPASFVHPDPLHPYSALWHPLTPLRWLFYLISAAIGWGGVLPMLAVGAVLQWFARLLLLLWERVFTSDQCWSGDAAEGARPESWHVVHPRLVRLHPVSPQDRIWLVARDASERIHAPGTAPSSIIHALLVFSRQVTVERMRERCRRSMERGGMLERMRWSAVRRRTRRAHLPSWLGGESQELCWMEGVGEDSFDVARHVRMVPYAEWMGQCVSSEWSNGRASAARGRQAAEIAWPPLNESLGGAPASGSDVGDGRDLEQPAASAHPPVDHAAVLRTTQLQSYLSHLSSLPLRANQPLWELLILEREDADEPSAAGSCECWVVFRCSHAVADGVLLSGVILQTIMGGGVEPPQPRHQAASPQSPEPAPTSHAGDESAFAASSSRDRREEEANLVSSAVSNSAVSPSPPVAVDSPSPPIPAPRPARLRPTCCSWLSSLLRSVSNWWLLFLTGPWLLLHKSFQPDDFNALTSRYAAPLDASDSATADARIRGRKKHVCWSPHPMSLARVKRMSKTLGVSLNDLLMSVWLDVLDEYMLAVENLERSAATRAHSTGASRIPRVTRAPARVFTIVPFNVRPQSDFHPPTEAARRKRGARAFPLGNKFAVLMVEVPAGPALRQDRNRDGSSQAGDSGISAGCRGKRYSRVENAPVCEDDSSAASSSALGSSDPASFGRASSFLRSPFLLRLRYLSSYMSLLKSRSLEALLMYGVLSALLACLPLGLANYIFDLYGSLATVVLTNNRSSEGRLMVKDDELETDLEEEGRQAGHAAGGAQAGHVSSSFSSSANADAVAASLNPGDSPLSPASPSPSPSSSPAAPRPRSHSPIFLDSWVSWAPQRSDTGLCVTLLTYRGELRVSIVAEARCIRYTTAAQLVERYQQKIEALEAHTR